MGMNACIWGAVTAHPGNKISDLVPVLQEPHGGASVPEDTSPHLIPNHFQGLISGETEAQRGRWLHVAEQGSHPLFLLSALLFSSSARHSWGPAAPWWSEQPLQLSFCPGHAQDRWAPLKAGGEQQSPVGAHSQAVKSLGASSLPPCGVGRVVGRRSR